MKKVFGYIRVSTVKQGTGVSLQEQKEAIIRYAEKHNLSIIDWFEELETAAKQGRPRVRTTGKECRWRQRLGVAARCGKLKASALRGCAWHPRLFGQRRARNSCVRC